MENKLPAAFCTKMQNLLKDDYQAYLDSFDYERQYGLRVNTLKISVEDFLKISPFKLEPIPWTTDGFYYQGEDKPAKHPYYYAGLYYLQEPSAMTPAEVLPIEEGDYVLDCCAAPGGKSTKLISKLNHQGLLVTNDISNSRAQALLKNIELCGADNAFVTSEDTAKLAKYFPNFFDKILIDAPCSGEGMFRKEPTMLKSWDENSNLHYHNLQIEIVEAALKMLKDGGSIVYSTCTFDPLENEAIIKHLLSLDDSLHTVAIKNRYEHFACGQDLKDAIRIYPHLVKGEGHFVCLIQKGFKQNKIIPYSIAKMPNNEDVLEFLKHMQLNLNNRHFEIIQDNVYLVPDIDIKLKGLRILRSGLLLGEIKKHHFEPAQSLAMALKMSDFDQVLNFDAKDERVIRYLKGETLYVKDLTTLQGWVLVCVSGYPLGFAKIDQGTLKNKYAKGWRYQ